MLIIYINVVNPLTGRKGKVSFEYLEIFSTFYFRVSSSQFPVPSLIQHPVSSIQYPASSIQHPVSSIQHPAPSTEHRVPIFTTFAEKTVIFPQNFEQKLGFDSIRVMIKDNCLCDLGRQAVDSIHFSVDLREIETNLFQTEELRQLLLF